MSMAKISKQSNKQGQHLPTAIEGSNNFEKLWTKKNVRRKFHPFNCYLNTAYLGVQRVNLENGKTCSILFKRR